MDSPKYLIIITLIDGQNFTVPDGSPDRVEATVFVEARFGNESILKSDPIKLVNSNPEFVTELAWQLDRKTLHQLRVERRAIKLQVFLQTKERKKPRRSIRKDVDTSPQTDATQNDDSNATHKVELIGYTILDIRSAQDRDQPKFQWLPLLNPKFRKSSYNRPEVQLAVTLSRIDEEPTDNSQELNCKKNNNNKDLETKSGNTNNKPLKVQSEDNLAEISEANTSNDSSKLYKTCLDITYDPNQLSQEETYENDINIRFKDGLFYIYDTKNKDKSTMSNCDERYRISVTIPFNSNLEELVCQPKDSEMYYFSISLFQSSMRTEAFKKLTCVQTKEVQFDLLTTDANILTTYFEIYSTLVIKLHQSSGKSLGIATVQLDQLCRYDRKRRSIEGIFAMQPFHDSESTSSSIHPSIGVSVILERLNEETNKRTNKSLPIQPDTQLEMARREHFGSDIEDVLYNQALDDTHQLTMDDTGLDECSISPRDDPTEKPSTSNGYEPRESDHHFCFTIDLKNFSYTPAQRLIPTLRELVVRYSYPFFGYKDTITTDSSIPISATKSIIVSGFCEFNFATTTQLLLTALHDIPLNFEILTGENAKLNESELKDEERLVATCNLNLAKTMNFHFGNLTELRNNGLSSKFSAPIYALDGNEIGYLEIYLCLKDLGPPNYDVKTSFEELDKSAKLPECEYTLVPLSSSPRGPIKNEDLLSSFIAETKSNFESWKEETLAQLEDEQRKRENERFKRIYQRFEAKDTKRELDFRRRLEELDALERRLKSSCNQVDSLSDRLIGTIEQIKNKSVILDSRVEALDLRLTKALASLQSDLERKIDSIPITSKSEPAVSEPKPNKVAAKIIPESSQARRSSLRNPQVAQGIPVPVRSSSLVRNDNGVATRLVVGRPKGMVTTVINGLTSKSRSNSVRANQPKEVQDKLAKLRREKADLLKRGCRPTDELILEINSLIEKLAF